MNSLSSPHLIHKFNLSFLPWCLGKGFKASFTIVLLIYSSSFPPTNLFYQWFLCSPDSSTSPSSSPWNRLQVSSNLKTIINKTPTILHASQLSLYIISLLSRLLESSSFSFAISLLFIQSSIKYDLASPPINPQKLLILKSLMTSSMLKPEDSWFFLTWLLWNIVCSPFWNPLLNFLYLTRL